MTGKFKELYDYCQNLEPKISRNLIRDKIQELCGNQILTIKADLDTSISRGYFISCENAESKFYKKVGGKDVIVLARELNKCWERFVYVKELMHVFDKPNELVGSSVDLGNLLNSFEIPPSINGNDPFKSEIAAFWMALSCLCPEHSRRLFLEQYSKGGICHYDIALTLRIPEQYVPFLFRDNFLQIIEKVKE